MSKDRSVVRCANVTGNTYVWGEVMDDPMDDSRNDPWKAVSSLKRSSKKIEKVETPDVGVLGDGGRGAALSPTPPFTRLSK